MSKVRPSNIQMIYAIGPTGQIRAVVPPAVDGCLPCDGRALRKEDWPALYTAVGDVFSEKLITVPIAQKWWQRLFRLKVKTKIVPNPAYNESEFRLPDLRGRYFVSGKRIS